MTNTLEKYKADRAALVKKTLEQQSDYAVRMTLSEEEAKLNDLVQSLKAKEVATIQSQFNGLHPGQVPITKLRDKYLLESKSPLWHLVKNMPKGCILHVHFDAIVNVKWVLEEALKCDKFYILLQEEAPKVLFRYFGDKNLMPKDKNWVNLKETRLRHPEGTKAFDKMLENIMTLTPVLENLGETSDSDVWKHFTSTFLSINGICSYEPIFRKTVLKKFQEMWEDGVSYFEDRIVGSAYLLYDDNGNVHTPEHTAKVFQECLQQFNELLKQNDDAGKLTKNGFFGSKIIYSGLKFTDKAGVRKDMENVIRVKQKYPDVICGFDLVGYEDQGYPYSFYAEEFVWFFEEQKRLGLHIPFLGHAGETVDSGSSADENLYDAIVLGAERIGHGLSLIKHPWLQKEVKEKNIAVEMCPISNKALKYTPTDLRLHPLISFMNAGIPVVLAPDDPAIFGIYENPCSYDFWMTLVLWSSFDLASMKRLILNSIEHSKCDDEMKKSIKRDWEESWKRWVQESLQYVDALPQTIS
jgi:adenosine deaminase CECR1